MLSVACEDALLLIYIDRLGMLARDLPYNFSSEHQRLNTHFLCRLWNLHVESGITGTRLRIIRRMIQGFKLLHVEVLEGLAGRRLVV